MNIRILLMCTLIIPTLFAPSAVHAQEGEEKFPTDNDVNAIAGKLYCPVCPNTPLDVCETKACQDWRAQIKQQLEDGWTEDQIIDYFVLQYGERVLANPKREGFTSLVWVLPVIAVVLGMTVIWRVIKGWWGFKKPSGSESNIEPGFDEESLARIERELDEMR
ncbi:MAG: hypothetical protein A2Z14_14955 [Chloroflexi bacterium RBG_16_48_8]|nr:MAG: hypothetical protein A2Z14_14955 [Chloroflexi bacterium RBG_16_48_8]